MKRNILEKQNIYAIPAGDIWKFPKNKIYIIYAPLGGQLALATENTVKELSEWAEGKIGKESIKKMLSSFQAKGKIPIHQIPESPDDVHQIDILCNYKCNFSCIYCYSAKGRSQKETNFLDIKAVVDYLFKQGRKQKKPYIINFSGGGEPLLSFPLIRKTIEYIHKVADDTQYKYNIGLVTNGSLITPEIIDFLIEKGIDMAVSFEVLPHLQNKERGSYEKVVAGIDLMTEKGYSFGIRTTFTPESVKEMCNIIEEIHNRFPLIKKVVFDIVLAPSLFETPEKLRDYYNTFLLGYYKAKKTAQAYNIHLESVAVETVSMLRDRTCQGKIVLTPSGTISSCARVSSPQETHYPNYIYGNVKDGNVVFDRNVFANILDTHNIYTDSKCFNCFAKWNCGGGCKLFHDSFGEEYNLVRCEFVRKALRLELAHIISFRFGKHTGNTLEEHLRNILQEQ